MPGSPNKIGDIPTPALVIDVDRVKGNIERYHGIAEREGVIMRPHGKTSKLPFIWDMQRKAGAEGLTVATLREAEVARVHGHEDILIAYPHVDPSALERIRNLMRAEIRVALLVANRTGADIVHGFFGNEAPDIMLAIDTGLHREGVNPRSEDTLQFIGELRDRFKDKFRGITTHEGHAYRSKHSDTVAARAKRARDAMVRLKRECEKRGIDFKDVALGSTPTFAYFKNDRKRSVTEAHPGNYVLMDNTQVQLGIAQPANCALTVIATVIGTRIERVTKAGQTEHVGFVFINAGAKSLSEAKRPHGEAGTSYGGLFSDPGATELDKKAHIYALSEEIGWIRVNPAQLQLDSPAYYKVGQRVRVLPQHACPTIAANRYVYLVEGETVLEHLPIVAGGHESYPGSEDS